ncbi:MAG: FtsX-like permease family protein [Anaerolineales bacterium]|nr:FtsX-like permease family protein [Anaerolineales bacterium]
MNIDTRWVKIWRDLWSNKTRSLLVILSIAVGVGTIGMIYNASRMIQRDLYAQFRQGNPAHVYLYVSPFPKEIANAAEGIRGVKQAQARRILQADVRSAKGDFENLSLNVIAEPSSFEVNRFVMEQGVFPPKVREIILERQSAQLLGYQVGDKVLIKLADERQYELTLSGIAHDLNEIPFAILGNASGYISMDTLRWMGEIPGYNRLEVVVEGEKVEKAVALEVAEKIKKRILEPSGYVVYSVRIPGVGSDPGDHWAHNQIRGFILILQIMSVMATLLSGGLIINTISAILIQQMKQIGILRAIGASRKQIISMYLLNILIFASAGLLLAIPLGLIGSWWLSNFAARFLNFNITKVTLTWDVLLIQVGVAIFMPIGVAIFPILNGTRISVYDAIYQHGLSDRKRISRFERLLSRIRSVNPPLLLSLRNTFRRKSRLVFTLGTLTLAGAMFIASFSTYSSLTAQIRDVERYMAFDARLSLPYGVSKVAAEREALRIAGISTAEGWAVSEGVIVRSDHTESQGIEIVGLPPDSKTIYPKLISGSWLPSLPNARQVVVNADLVMEEPEIQVGKEIQIKVAGRTHTFTVVGIVSKHIFGPRIYMDLTALNRLMGRNNEVDEIRVLAEEGKLGSLAVQNAIAEKLQARFNNAGLSKNNSETRSSFFSEFTEVFNIILFVLLLMAGLLALVGSLGLSGTLGINIMERMREIGVLRAVGAANQALVKIVLTESMVVSLVSWVMGAITSAISSPILAAVVIYAVLETQMNFRYSMIGLLLWFGVILLIGVFSSLLPARRAALLQVREVLDYE